MKKYWFKPKTYGWGFVPISIEGWLVVAATLGAVILSAELNKIYLPQETLTNQIAFLLKLIVIITLSSIISMKKTKGKVTWNWGKQKTSQKE